MATPVEGVVAEAAVNVTNPPHASIS